MPQPDPEIIRRVPLFSDLDKRELERVAQAFKERQYRAGDVIAEEGKSGVGFFLIGQGEATVSVGGHERTKLGPGEAFGEIALLSGAGSRTATVTADTDMIAYGMTFWDFRPIVETNAQIAWKLLQKMAERLRAVEQQQQSA